MNITEKESEVNDSANKLQDEHYENYLKEYSKEKTQSKIVLKPLYLVYPEVKEKPTLIRCLNHRQYAKQVRDEIGQLNQLRQQYES
jgi:hypothetical protein